MNAFKIRHKPTGLWYQPVKGRWARTKSNIGKHGKVYISIKPTLEFITRYNHISENICKEHGIEWQDNFKIPLSDWELVTYELVETKEYVDLVDFVKWCNEDISDTGEYAVYVMDEAFDLVEEYNYV